MTETLPPPVPSSWVVTSQQQNTGLDQTGTYVQGWTVYFTTGEGHNGSVFLSDAYYNPTNVRAAIAAKAATIDAVGQLSS